ncbi:unnamed protein product, partial [Closterium sp. NIES-64]
GRAIDFEVWLDDLQLFLQCDRADGLSLFDLTSGASPAPAADADPTVRSQWATRDAAARLAVRRHLPTSERAHFSQYKSAQTLYDAVVARYSSPATAALSRLMLPYLFPDLSAFPTVADLITHLRTSDTRYRAALPAEFCAKNPPPMYIALYYVVARLPDSLRVGCSPSPLLPSVASAAAADLLGLESVGAASAPSGRRRSARARGARARVELEGAVAVAAVAAEGVGVAAGLVAGVVVVVAAAAETVVVVAAVVVEAAAEVEAAEVEAVEAAAEEAVVVEEGGAGRGGTQQRSGGGGGQRSQRQQQQRSRDIPPPQQLREWYTGRQRGGGTGPCTYVLRSGDRAGEQCGGAHATQRCFGRLTDAWRQQFPGASEIPRWDELLGLPDPGIGTAALGACEAAALGASASALSGTGETALSGTASSSSSLTFTLDSGASRSFFRDRTTLTPLGRPVAVSLADPSGGPVLSHFSTVLPCPAAPSGTLSGLYLPSFSTNLVSGAGPAGCGGSPVHSCESAGDPLHGRHAQAGHLATFSRRPGSSLYTLTTESPPVPASGQVLRQGQVLAAASRLSLLSPPGQDLPVSPVSRVASGLLLTPPTSPRQRLPLQTLHMDVWGPAPVRGQGHERYFLLVVDDYSRYTTVLPLRSKGAVTEVLIDWIREARLQLRKSFGSDFPVLRLHSDRGGEFSSRLLRDYCRARGIRQTFTLPDSPQQNGIAERRIGMVMDVARTSMMHAAAPHFLWPFAVRYAAHQLNLHPRVSRPCDVPSPCCGRGRLAMRLLFRVWGSRAFVRDLSADKLSPRAAPCVFLGFPTDAPGWQFYHPSSRRVLSSQDVTFDESVPFYRLFPYRTPSLPPPPDFLVPVPPPVDPLPPQVPAPSGVSQVDAVDPVEVTGDSGAAAGAEPGGADSGGAVRGGAEPGGATAGGAGPEGATAEGAEPGGAEPGGAVPGGAGSGGAGSGAAEPGGAELGAAEPGGAASGAAEPGVSPAAASRREPLSPQELREWFARRWRRAAESGAAGPAGPPGAGAAEGVGAEPTAVGPAAGGVGGAGAVAEGAGAVPAESGAAVRPRPYFVPLLQQVLGLSPPVEGPPPVQSQSLLEPSSPLPAPSPYTGPTGGLAERREPASRPASPSTAASALVAELVDFAARCRLDYAASLVAESASVCPPSVGGECALGTDVLEDRQEELQCLAAASPHLASVLLAPEGDPDALDIPTPRSYAEAVEGPYSSQWQAAMDAEMASWKSTGTYVDAVPPPGANIVSGMWIFRVKRPPGSPPVFKARYVARGFSQRQGVDYFQTFSPTPKMTTLRGSLHEEIWLRRPPGFTGTFPPGTQWSLRRPVYGLRQAPREWHDTLRTTLAALGFAPSTADPSLFLRTDTSLPPFYILVYVDDLVFATADTAGLAYVKSELLKRHTCTDLGELRSYLGLQITRDRARRTITLTQSHMVQQVLQRFGFTYSSPQATPLPTRHSLSALPSDESVESSGPYAELVGCLMYLMTCTRPDLAYPLSILARYVAPGRHRPEHMAAAKRVLRYLCSTSGMGLVLGGRSPVVLTGHADASWADDQATQRSSQGYTFSLGSGSVSWRSTRSSSVLGSSCEAEIYAGAMAAQELRWLTYLLTDLGEPPRSPPVLYVDNKAMLALCREQRLEHRTKHIALRYFLARELQQRGQLRLAYVASEANTADVFHQGTRAL